MLFPEKLLKVYIEIPSNRLNEELESIGKLGIVDIDESKRQPKFELELVKVNSLIAVTRSILDSLNLSADVNPSKPVQESLEDIENELLGIQEKVKRVSNLRKMVQDTASLVEKAEAIKKHLTEIDIESLEKNLKFIRSSYGLLPSGNLESFILSVKSLKLFYVYSSISPGTSCFAVFYLDSDREDVERILSSFGISVVKNTYFLPSTLKKLNEDKLKLSEEISSLKQSEGKRSQRILSNLLYLKEIFSAETSLISESGRFVLEGWVPKKELGSLRKSLKYSSLKVENAGRDAPTLLRTPSVLKPFERLVTSFSYPGYNDINPTLPFAVTFLIIFGMMFGDVGHGLSLFVGGFLIRGKYRDLGKIISLSGISSTIFGFLYGSFFGFEFKPILFNPMRDIDKLVAFSLATGIIVITIGFMLNAISLFKKRNIWDLISGEAGIVSFLIYWLTIAIAIKALVFKLSVKVEMFVLLGLFLLFVVVGYLRNREFLASAMDVINNFVENIVNTISFIRLGAFALAHAALLFAVFSIANSIKFVGSNYIIIVTGNIVIIVLEGLVVTIQTLRLNYYEFFKKFFKGNGRPFKAFMLEGR